MWLQVVIFMVFNVRIWQYLNVRLYLWHYGTCFEEMMPQRKSGVFDKHPDGFTVSSSSTITQYYLAWTGVFFSFKCIVRDRYDGNVFNFVRAKWCSGTARFIAWFRTGKASASSAAESGLSNGADATTARGWRASSAKARSHEWTFLLIAGTTRYFNSLVPALKRFTKFIVYKKRTFCILLAVCQQC